MGTARFDEYPFECNYHIKNNRHYGLKKKEIGVIYPNDSWILETIGKEIVKAGAINNHVRDINMWVNWKYWSAYKLKKSLYDIVLFTHLENGDTTDILDLADMIVCMSEHGRGELESAGISSDKIKVCPSMGVSTTHKKKIVIGTSGRSYDGGRKNWEERNRLQTDLSDIFEFEHANLTDDAFFKRIDYYLQTSTAEGGSMDVLNAIFTRTPVVSRDIGFISQYKTPADFIYDNYDQLLGYFKSIEEAVKKKDEYSKCFSWDLFHKWINEIFSEAYHMGSFKPK
jgi:hypothetical protein